MEIPRITIVTPSYNQGEFLETAIRSVVSQAHPNLEYFVFDGGSTDRSVSVIKDYDDRIDYVQSQKDDGQSDAIASGFEMASGEILGWINSDDALFPGALREIARAFSQNPSIDVFCSEYAYLSKDGEITQCHIPIRPCFRHAKRGCLRIGQQATFFRRSFYEGVGGLRRDFHFLMDTELWLRMLQAGGRFGVLRKLTGAFRWHGEMKSLNREGRKAEEMSLLQELHGFDQRGGMATIARLEHKLQGLVGGAYWGGFKRMRSLKGMSIDDLWSQCN